MGVTGKGNIMAIIHYEFADGHFEDVECTEEFKREYEFMLVREKALYWKEMKQKERAGLRCVPDYSLDKYHEDGYDLPGPLPDPLDELIWQEERDEYYRRLLAPLTDNQREVYILHHIKGYRKVKIAAILHISEMAVRITVLLITFDLHFDLSFVLLGIRKSRRRKGEKVSLKIWRADLFATGRLFSS